MMYCLQQRMRISKRPTWILKGQKMIWRDPKGRNVRGWNENATLAEDNEALKTKDSAFRKSKCTSQTFTVGNSLPQTTPLRA